MARFSVVAALTLALCSGVAYAGILDNRVDRGSDELPTISESYYVEGTLYIPYAEIEEPFAAWYDQKTGRSRIDFYGGVSKTFQLSKVNGFGVMRKIVPMTNDKLVNKVTCFEVNGTAISLVEPQSILPDLTNFTYAGIEMLEGIQCKKYQLVTKSFQKTSKYTFWVKTTKSPVDPYIELGIPVKYEMRGYNSLLGSHYDHYYLTYDFFSADAPSDETFDVPTEMECGDFPGPGAGHHKSIATFNPMKEFIHGHDEHVTAEFETFVDKHNKKYDHAKEQEERLNIFRHNFRYVHSKNRQGLSYRLGLNHLADRTDEERKVLRGKLYSKGYNGGQPMEKFSSEDIDALPETYDWRLLGAVTPVKDQSVCGSCWSFGTIGAIEGAYFLKTGDLVRLSQQALVDCSWGYGNNGCDGGEDFRAYQYMMEHGGIPSEDAYGPYMGIDGFCHVQDVTPTATITGYVNVTGGEDALKLAIFKHGPISVAIDASHRSLSFYAYGVYSDPKCGNTLEDLDHAVLAVGYGTLNNEPYWLIKNSWSTYWGNDGYVLISRKDNMCGVASSPTYVTM